MFKNLAAITVAAQERGKLAIAYHPDMRAVAPHAQIAKGDTLSEVKILGLNWLVAGVQGRISH